MNFMNPYIGIALAVAALWYANHLGYKSGIEHMRQNVQSNCEQKVGWVNADRCVRDYTYNWEDLKAAHPKRAAEIEAEASKRAQP